MRQCSTEDIASIKRIYTEVMTDQTISEKYSFKKKSMSFLKSFTDLSEKYVAVRKFISSSANKLKKIEK